MPVNGFVSPGEELPEDEVEDELHALTFQTYDLPPITRGTYILNEEDLPESYKELLHGRAFIIDREMITESDSGAPKTYYIAADQVQGLIVPARSIFIKSEEGESYYRWTDSGEKWSDWITLQEGQGHAYQIQELCRFAEVQVYADESGALITLRATR